ncbi:MAG: hypothetical protein Q8916_03230 [Bacteroidota bacterium]|nr:hypothetical protein [Bacteroidota bacterium]MDP4229401.1 hypothetical protein [Bacteroidota bacterium]
MSAIIQAIQLVRPRASQSTISREATKFFVIWFGMLSVALYGGGTLVMNLFSTEAFRTACYVGMGLCTVTSVASFFLTEWAIDQPNDIFFGVAISSIFVRIFGLVLAFAMCQFLFKINPIGLVTGMFASYFSYLVVEIIYIHKKSLTRGE